jgi:hypothetical protein
MHRGLAFAGRRPEGQQFMSPQAGSIVYLRGQTVALGLEAEAIRSTWAGVSPPDKSNMAQYLFGGFTRCLYPVQNSLPMRNASWR